VPSPTIGRWSTYTVRGLMGYVTGAVGVGVISAVARGGFAERAIAIVAPLQGPRHLSVVRWQADGGWRS